MTFLILPSSRLAAYFAQTNQVRILPIRAEEYLIGKSEMHNILAASYMKTLKFYDPSALLKAEHANAIEPISSVIFNKKLQGLTTNKKGKFYVSDKFGDIYSITKNQQQKYLNSNLGIPTLLKYIKTKTKNLMLVGDQQTRIKIYNEERMHEIISFWFLVRRVPLQLIQPVEDKIVLMVKKQNQVNIQMHQELDQFVELYVVDVKELEASEMNGKVFCVSKEKDQFGDCRYQTIIHSEGGDVFLLKLYSQKIVVQVFKQFIHDKTYVVEIQQNQWNHLHAQVSTSKNNRQILILSFGKSYQIDEKQDLPFEIKDLTVSKQKQNSCKINKDEHILVYEL